MKFLSVFMLILFSVVFSSGCTTWDITVENTSVVRGLDVGVSHAGGTFWRVTAKNNSTFPAKLIWDESSYISTTGMSSRLVRGNTRIIHSGQSQPTSPIPPGATINEIFLREENVNNANSMYIPAPGDPDSAAQIYLMFEINNQKSSYTARIKFTKPTKK